MNISIVYAARGISPDLLIMPRRKDQEGVTPRKSEGSPSLGIINTPLNDLKSYTAAKGFLS